MDLVDKTTAITESLAAALNSMFTHGYSEVEAEWQWRSPTKTVANGKASFEDKVYDCGVVKVRRNKQGAILVRITDKFTEKKK